VRWSLRGKKKSGERQGVRSSAAGQVLEHLQKVVVEDLCKTHWVDSTDHKVSVRQRALPEIVFCLGGPVSISDCCADDILSNVDQDRQGHVKSRERALPMITRLSKMLHKEAAGAGRSVDREWMESTFFGAGTADANRGQRQSLPVVWHNNMGPRDTHRWVIHLLSSMGKLSCEASIPLGTASARECPRRAQLWGPNEDPGGQVRESTRRCAVGQLACTPGGTSAFDRSVVTAHRAARESILHDRSTGDDDTPPFLFTRLRDCLTGGAMVRK